MQFFEYGKPDGVPLVFMLGTPHTGDSVAELSGLAAETGVQHSFLLHQMLESAAGMKQPDQNLRTRSAHSAFRMSEPFRAKLVIDILERRKAGHSFGCIAHTLNEQGIPGENGGRWYGATLRNIVLRAQSEVD